MGPSEQLQDLWGLRASLNSNRSSSRPEKDNHPSEEAHTVNGENIPDLWRKNRGVWGGFGPPLFTETISYMAIMAFDTSPPLIITIATWRQNFSWTSYATVSWRPIRILLYR